jgi:hypothetical protein
VSHAAELGGHFLDATRRELRSLKRLGERALAQVSDDARLHARLDPESNSLAVLVRHLAGNMLSRWTDFLASDGEKPTRDRDGEFEDAPALDRAALLEAWEHGWSTLLAALDALGPDDLLRTVTIRGRSLSVLEAVQRQLVHYADHVGQMVFVAKHLESQRWQSLSVPRRQRGA